jgi:hypothetical protein
MLKAKKETSLISHSILETLSDCTQKKKIHFAKEKYLLQSIIQEMLKKESTD